MQLIIKVWLYNIEIEFKVDSLQQKACFTASINFPKQRKYIRVNNAWQCVNKHKNQQF